MDQLQTAVIDNEGCMLDDVWLIQPYTSIIEHSLKIGPMVGVDSLHAPFSPP